MARADDEGQWRTADGEKFLLLFRYTRNIACFVEKDKKIVYHYYVNCISSTP